MALELNDKEQKIYGILKRGKKTIEELAKEAWASKGVGPNTKGNSHVRNSLRKLVNNGVAKQIARGTYELTGKKLEDVKDKPKATKKTAPKNEKKAAAKKTAPKGEKKPAKKPAKKAAKASAAAKRPEGKHATTATPLGTKKTAAKKGAPKAEAKGEAKEDGKDAKGGSNGIIETADGNANGDAPAAA